MAFSKGKPTGPSPSTMAALSGAVKVRPGRVKAAPVKGSPARPVGVIGPKAAMGGGLMPPC